MVRIFDSESAIRFGVNQERESAFSHTVRVRSGYGWTSPSPHRPFPARNQLEPNAFLSNPKMTAINVAAANADYSSLDGVLFNKDKKELIVYPTGKEGAYTVPDGVETILDDAFAGNTHLTAVTLPASLGEIASLAFENCTGLTSITSLATTAPHAGSQAFDNVPKSIPVYVPKDGLASYKAEDKWKDFDNFITLEDKAAAEAVVAKIEAIGTVEYTDECKAKIDDARKDYDALSEGAKKVITAEQLKVLTDAEAGYEALKKAACKSIGFLFLRLYSEADRKN